MPGNQNKTRQTKASPRKFIETVEPARRREDGLVLLDFFNRVTELEPHLWGESLIGYGRYAYKYDSGREGEFFLTGFSPRKSALTMYVMAGYRDMPDKLAELGKHKIGKSCLYINKLSDVDMAVLEEIVRDDLAYMRKTYQTWDV
ncbi:MAG: DUF1801 domain-containing protein [Pseudomonadota bacterium]